MNLSELGSRIRTCREKCRLTQAQLANTLLISPQAVSKWERGDNAPDIALIVPLARVLGVDVQWLLSGEEAGRDTFEATVMCTSLRSFAQRSSLSAPRDVALFINGVFHTLTESVLRHQGVPVKYVGDGFLSYFAGEHQTERALAAACDAVKAVADPDLLITLSAGPVYLGTIGHHEYARPDIMGETVNTAFLLNHWATAACDSPIVLTSSACPTGGTDFKAIKPATAGLPAEVYGLN